jgi:hypothetical protein
VKNKGQRNYHLDKLRAHAKDSLRQLERECALLKKEHQLCQAKYEDAMFAMWR